MACFWRWRVYAWAFYWLSWHQVPRFTLWLLVGGILVRLVVIWILHPPLESDFEKLYEAAQSLLAGDLSFNSTPYFRLWAYQSAYVCWEAMWLTIWNHPIFLEIVHACFAAGTVCLLYRIVLPHVRQSSAQLMALLLTCFPFACTLTTVLTNQIPSAFFSCIGNLAFDLSRCRASSFLEVSPLWCCTPDGQPFATGGHHYTDSSVGMAILFPAAGAKAGETSAMWRLGIDCSLLCSRFWCGLACESHGFESQRFTKLVSWMEVCLRVEP